LRASLEFASGDEFGRPGGATLRAHLAAEHLAEEDGLHIDAETLRRWMLEHGLWMRTRGRKSAHLHRRPRKEHFGELVQLDGSFHTWYEQRGPQRRLMNMVDDATGIAHARLGEAETIWAAAQVLRAWIERYGVTLALYTDWKNVYKVAPTPQQELRGEEPLTQFGRMCMRLGIRIVGAHLPQAKGSVERNHGVHQVDYRGEAMAFIELSGPPPRAPEQATVHVRCWRRPYRPGPESAYKPCRPKHQAPATSPAGQSGGRAPRREGCLRSARRRKNAARAALQHPSRNHLPISTQGTF